MRTSSCSITSCDRNSSVSQKNTGQRNLHMERFYLVPVKQESIYQTPDYTLTLCGLYVVLDLLEFANPPISDLVVDLDLFLFVEVVVTSMIRGYLASLLDLLKKFDEPRPSYGTRRCIPILDIVHRMERYELLGLRKGHLYEMRA